MLTFWRKTTFVFWFVFEHIQKQSVLQFLMYPKNDVIYLKYWVYNIQANFNNYNYASSHKFTYIIIPVYNMCMLSEKWPWNKFMYNHINRQQFVLPLYLSTMLSTKAMVPFGEYQSLLSCCIIYCYPVSHFVHLLIIPT